MDVVVNAGPMQATAEVVTPLFTASARLLHIGLRYCSPFVSSAATRTGCTSRNAIPNALVPA